MRFKRSQARLAPRYRSAGRAWPVVLLLFVLIGLAVLQPDRTTSGAFFQSPLDQPTFTPEVRALPTSPVATPPTPPTLETPPTPLFFPTQPPRQAVPTQPFRPAVPGQPITALPSPTPTRTPSATPTATTLPPAARTATAVAASFLPPPTLTAPGILPPSSLLQPDPPGEPTPPAAPPPVAPAAAPSPGAGLRDLLSSGLLVVVYLWLGCAALVLAGLVAGAVFFLWKRRG